MKELQQIQTKLVAPKGQKNDFGGYKYRSLEDICEAVKPLLKETGCTLTFSDDLVLVGNRYYIKSTATITNEAGEQISCSAFAREQESKKGMDEAQITGSASSYARKYAACSLLAIDDNKEPDMCDNRDEGIKSTPKPLTARKTPKKGEKITLSMVKDGACDAIVQKLAAIDGNPAEKAEAARAVREFYAWESDEAYSEILARAARVASRQRQRVTPDDMFDSFASAMINK